MIFLDKMNTKQFTSLIFASFITGIVLLIIVQYNSATNMDNLITGNERLLKEIQTTNRLREIERDIIWVESRLRAAIATDDISHIDGVDGKILEVENYLDSLQSADTDLEVQSYIQRLRVLALHKLESKKTIQNDYQLSGRMDDTSMISNPRARNISNEISSLTRKIYNSRQRMIRKLSLDVEESGRKARQYGVLMIGLITMCGFLLLWFIINRIRRQNLLIEQLDISDKKAREAAIIKENFMANMSHEIRTPLNAILGFTNLLRQRQLDKEPAEFVGAIQKAGESLLTIINDILDLSKIEAGMMRIENTAFSVRGLFDSIKTLFGEKVKEKNLTVKLDIDANVPDTLVGDATRLTQILVNLISNAIKFTEKGHIHIYIFSKGITDNKIQLGISISDTGIGIEKDKVNGIFERFHQAEDSTTRNYGGTGLGLAIVKDLLTLQNGSIAVSSVIGKGTTFTMVIPYQVSLEQFTEKPATQAISFKNLENKNCRLLVVDDNEMNQSLMKHLLKSWDFEHDIAGNATDAIAMLQNNTYDMVLMDIQMPGMDGYEATQYIRNQLLLKLPIIAMTAHALAGEREKCLSYGMNEYLSKPIVEQQLYNFILKFTNAGTKTAVTNTPDNFDANNNFIDVTYLKDISKGNTVFEKKATSQFLNLLPQSLEKLEVAIATDDLKTIRAVAHDLKTTVSIMGLTTRLESILETLEFSDDKAHITKAYSDLKDLCLKALLEAQQFHDAL